MQLPCVRLICLPQAVQGIISADISSLRRTFLGSVTLRATIAARPNKILVIRRSVQHSPRCGPGLLAEPAPALRDRSRQPPHDRFLTSSAAMQASKPVGERLAGGGESLPTTSYR